MSQASDNSRESEYHTIYPFLSYEEETDSLHDSLNELEEYFNTITEKHTLYIEARQKTQTVEQARLTETHGRELIVLEQSLRERLRALTQHQFQELETDIFKRYNIVIGKFNEFITVDLQSNYIKAERKREFADLCGDLLTLVEERDAFKEQKLLPDQFRILRATAAGVNYKLQTKIRALEKELESERKTFDRQLKRQTEEIVANYNAASATNFNLKREIEGFTEEVGRLTGVNIELEAKVATLQRKVRDLQQEIELDSDENKTLESSFADQTLSYETKIKNINEQRALLQQTILEKDSLLESTRSSEKTLRDKLEKTNQVSKQTLINQKENYEAKILVLQNENERLEQLLKEYKSLNEAIRTQFGSSHSELIDLHTTFESKQNEINAQYFQSIEGIQENLKQIIGEINQNIELTKETANKVTLLNQETRPESNLQAELITFNIGEDEEEEIEGDHTFQTRFYDQTPRGGRVITTNHDKIKALETVIVELSKKLQAGQEETSRLQRNLTAKVVGLNECRKRVTELTENIAVNQEQLRPDIMEAALARNLGDLFSREEKKSIPYFNGQSDGKTIHDFLKTCKKVADNNGWDEKTRIRNFADRLTGEANEWHCEFMDNLPIDPRTINRTDGRQTPPIPYTRDNLEYSAWEAAFLQRFTNIGQIEKLRNQLHLMRQNSDQDVQAFIYKINNLYNIVNGSSPKLPEDASDRERELSKANDRLRSQDKFKILLKGLLPNIKSEIWSRLNANASYEEACAAALEAEGIVINKQISEDKGLTAVVAGFSVHEEQQDKELKIQKAEIEMLKHHMNALTLSNNLQGMDQSPKLVAAVTEERPRSRIRFDRSLSEGRDNRDLSKNKSDINNYSRSPSPFTPRYDRDARERQPRESRIDDYKSNRTQSYPRERSNSFGGVGNREYTRRDQSDWRNRSQTSSRNPSVDRRGDQFRYNRNRPNRFQNDRFQQRPFNPRGSFRNSRFSGGNRLVQNRDNNFRGRQFTEEVSKESNNSNLKNCYYCGKPNHIARECRKRMRDRRGVSRTN